MRFSEVFGYFVLKYRVQRDFSLERHEEYSSWLPLKGSGKAQMELELKELEKMGRRLSRRGGLRTLKGALVGGLPCPSILSKDRPALPR